MHEALARQLTNALDAYLGTELKVKVQTLDQFPLKDHIAGIPSFTYIVPLLLNTPPCSMIAEFDIDLIFPVIDILLGGSGALVHEGRELSEIEDEIMQDLIALIARQAERAWGMPDMSLTAKGRIEPSTLHQVCPPNEKITLVKFEMEIGEVVGVFQFVFPTSFVTALIKHSQQDEPQKKGKLRYFPAATLRERILDCDVVVAADLPSMKVSVRDLVALQPGCVLKLRAPVRNPGMLTVGGCEIFEAAPVRNGAQKAAQVGRKVQPANWGKE